MSSPSRSRACDLNCRDTGTGWNVQSGNSGRETGTISVKEATSRFLAIPTNHVPMTTDKKPHNAGDDPARSGFSYATAAFAEWLAHRFRPQDPWRHALTGLARYLRRRL